MILTLRYKTQKGVREIHFESKDSETGNKEAHAYCKREGFLFIQIKPFLTEIKEQVEEVPVVKGKVA